MSTPAAPNQDPERAPLLPNNNRDENEAEPRVPFWKRKSTIIATLSVLVIGALIAVAVYFSFRRAAHSDPKLRYPNESIIWKPCGEVQGLPLECSTIDVPMDHFNASRSGDKTFSIPMVRLRGNADARYNILLNPGGPGGSGVDLVKRGGAALHTLFKGEFHLIGFDPRGIGASRPQASCFPDAEMRRTHGFRFNGKIEHDAGLYYEAGNIGEACGENLGEYGPHINTPQTAADMNSILDAVGQDNLYYVGYSYGTALGATYANMFPERSERVVIDGVLNSFIWYNDLLIEPFFQDTTAVVEAFFDQCAKAGDRCALSKFGDTGAAIEKKLTLHLDELQKSGPVPVYINSTAYGTISRNSITKGIFMASYTPARWGVLAENLAKLLSGNLTDVMLAYPDRDPQEDTGHDEANVFVTANDMPSGVPAWPSTREEALGIIIPSARRQAKWKWNYLEMDTLIMRAQWPIAKAHDFKPKEGVETLHPVLVMSTTYDPVCPLASAKILRNSFVGSKLIEVKGHGHCSIAMPSTCANKLLYAYFSNGTLPEKDHVKCDPDEGYFIQPDSNDKAKLSNMAVGHDEKMLAAMRSLADGIITPRF